MKTVTNTIVRDNKAKRLSDFRTASHICVEYHLQALDITNVLRLLVSTSARS